LFGQGSEWVAKNSQMMVLMSGPIGSANNPLPPRGHWWQSPSIRYFSMSGSLSFVVA